VAAFVFVQLQPHVSGLPPTPLMTGLCALEKFVGHAGWPFVS
jgi:hypothetical protein